jgi:hypothetical protein
MCGFIAGVLVLIFVFVSTSNYLQQNPEYWWVIFLIIAAIAIAVYLFRRIKVENNRTYLLRIADELEAIIADFANIDTYLTLQKGEKAIYERGGVQLREYKGTGSSFQSGNAGVIVRATNNIGVTLGGSRGSLTPNPEQQTVIDVGTLIFTNQRILFAGPNHAREWEFSKLINFSTGDNGFVADIAVSNRPRVSAIAGDSQHGITPGIMASICIDLFQDGEDKARATAQELIDGIRTKAAANNRK